MTKSPSFETLLEQVPRYIVRISMRGDTFDPQRLHFDTREAAEEAFERVSKLYKEYKEAEDARLFQSMFASYSVAQPRLNTTLTLEDEYGNKIALNVSNVANISLMDDHQLRKIEKARDDLFDHTDPVATEGESE